MKSNLLYNEKSQKTKPFHDKMILSNLLQNFTTSHVMNIAITGIQ